MRAFDVNVDFDVQKIMESFKLNELHLNEIESEDVEHLEESNKKILYVGQNATRVITSKDCSNVTSMRENSIGHRLPPKLNLKIQTLENLQTDSDKLFLLDLSRKKIDKSNIESRASGIQSNSG